MASKTKKTKSAADIRAEYESARAALDEVEREEQAERERAMQADHERRMAESRAIVASADDLLAVLRRKSEEASAAGKKARNDGDLAAHIEAAVKWHAERQARERLYGRLDNARAYLESGGEAVRMRQYPVTVRHAPFDGAKVLAEFVASRKERIPSIADQMVQDAIAEIMGGGAE